MGHTLIQKQGKEGKMFLISFSPSMETYPQQEEEATPLYAEVSDSLLGK